MTSPSIDATARPWELSRSYRRLIEKEVVGMADGYDSYSSAEVRFHSLIGLEEADANAALIVEAVNAYDSNKALIASLEAEKAELVEALRNARSSLIAFGLDPQAIHRESNGRFGDEVQVVLLDQIDSALNAASPSDRSQP